MFNKDYEKYKGCILPIEDNDKVILESSCCLPNKEIQTDIGDMRSLYFAFTDIIGYSFYDPFNSKIYFYNKDGTREFRIGHDHDHVFENVIRKLYYQPESFSIDEKDYLFYSQQELKFLRRLKNFLLAIGLKDVNQNDTEAFLKRAKNERAKEFLKCRSIGFENNHRAKDIIDGKIVYQISPFYKFMDSTSEEKYLIIDYNEKYLGIVESTKKKIKVENLIKDKMNYSLFGYSSLKEYQREIIKNLNDDNYEKENSERYVILEN